MFQYNPHMPEWKPLGGTLLLVYLLILLTLTGCANKAKSGAGLGALGGGLIGSLAGPSKNKEQNALIGAAIGGLLGYTVGNEMDKEDRIRLTQVYEINPDQKTSSWVNPNTGNSYVVTPSKTHIVEGRPCRRAVIDSIIGGKREKVTKTACRRKNGTWEI